MRYLILLALALFAALAVACGDDDGDGGSPDPSDELADVCTEEAPDNERIKVSSPNSGDDLSSPLVVTGEINTENEEFWVSAVNADGDHIIDYPARSRDYVEGELSPFEVSVPFTVGEETPACIWVYRVNLPEPEGAIKVPVTLLPAASPEAGE
jgi:hypothetical protein